MAHFLIDEDLPRSLGNLLRQHGHSAQHIIDLRLRGASDMEVFAKAQKLAAVLISHDAQFGNVLEYPLGAHRGIVVVQFPSEMRSKALIDEVVKMLHTIHTTEFEGALIVLEPGRVRIRRPP